MIDLKFIGNRIRELRLERELTQNKFADLLCISFQAVSNWERGITAPDLDNIVLIAELFGITVDELLRPSSEELFLGIDGGGTKTEFAVISSDGSVLMRTVRNGCNPNDIGYSKTLALIREGIDGVLSKYRSIKSVFLGIAGITVGDHKARLCTDLKKCYPKIKIQIQSDTFNLFAMCDDASMAVISGTGSVVFVKTENEYKRIGGWGYLLDDTGSAYDIGKEAIRVALYEEDMKKSPSRLSNMLRRKLNTKTVWEHLNKIYSEGKPYIAELASVVFEAYCDGDEDATRIIDKSVMGLAKLLNAGVEIYGAKPIAVASGGLFTHYPEIMREQIKKYTDVKLIISGTPPIYGACRSARLAVDPIISENFYDNFKKTYEGAIK